MKYILLTLAVVSILACMKQEEVKVSGGENDVILYRQSLTTDNYLKTVTMSADREYKAFNKDKVAYVRFNKGTKAPVYYANINYKHYDVKVVFKDSTSESFLAYSKDTINAFKLLPKGENLLHTSHQAKVVSWTKSVLSRQSINEFRGEKKISVQQWMIKFDGRNIMYEYKYPSDKSTNIWTLPNK